MLNRIDIYRVRVRGEAGKWTGFFIEMPDSQQIEEALRLDLAELNLDLAELNLEIEHENDQADALRSLLEIIPLYDPAYGDDVRVAKVFIGTVTIESIQGFGEVELPVHADFPTKNGLLLGDVP